MLENLTKKQKIILSIIAILVAIGIIYFINNKNQTNNIELDENILVSNQNTKQMSQDTEEIVIVHIIGSVKNPGIVKLKEGSRIEDAIEAAGGLTENADISNVNLAYVLDDGTKIKIPNLDDEDIGDEDVLSKDSGEGIIQEDEKTTNTNIVNINKATENELSTLPGIGNSLATRIVEYRKQNGNFKTIEDIKNVSGIGESKFANIKDFISIK